MWRQGKVVIHLTEAKYGGWSSDGTTSSVAGIRPPEATETEARGAGIGGRISQQYSEKDGDKRERRGGVAV